MICTPDIKSDQLVERLPLPELIKRSSYLNLKSQAVSKYTPESVIAF